MLLSSESFRDYVTVLLNDTFDYANFKSGIYGLKLSDLKDDPGLGAACINALADIFQIPQETEVLKFNLDSDYQVKYTLSPTFKIDKEKDENGEEYNVLYFIIGDWKLDLGSVYETVEAINCTISTDVLDVPQSDKTVKYYAGFTFNLNPKRTNEAGKEIRSLDKSKVLSFILSFKRDPEDSQQRLVDLFNNSDGDFGNLYAALVDSPYVATVGEAFTFAKLKELPIGAYQVSQIEWEDKEITKKDSGEKARIQNWKFRAVSLADRSVYYVNASKGSFFGKAITNGGEGSSPILNIAGKGKGGSVLMTLEALEKVPQGISPKGKIPASQGYVNAQLPKLIAASLQVPVNTPALRSAAVIQAPVAELAPAF